MYCVKCGEKILDGASFCQNCGTKVGKGEIQQSAHQAVQEPVEQSVKQPAGLNNVSGSKKEFKEFVDNHVRQTTGFQSAEELISASKPWKFAWICIGILSLIGLVLGAKNMGGASGIIAGVLIFGGFFGYVLVFIASGIIRSQYRAKFNGKININIDYDDYIAFLNEHLKYVASYYHECGYVNSRGGLQTIITNAVSRAAKEVTICCQCGSYKKYLATICIRPDLSNPESGQMQYFVDAVRGGFLIDGRAAGFLGHGCLIRTAPVMQASIEYYASLKQNGK